jgi:hypothetical protein
MSPKVHPTLCSKRSLRLFDHIELPGVTRQATDVARIRDLRAGCFPRLAPRIRSARNGF